MTEKVKGLLKKTNFKHKAKSIPLETGVLNFSLELIELTDTNTKKKRYVASIEFGTLGEHIELPPENYRQTYQEIKRKLEKGEYRAQISSDNSLDISINE